MPAAPTRGRRNCSRCTRWRPVSDFPPGRTHARDGTPLERPQLSSWCAVCRREVARDRARRRYYERKAADELAQRRALMRARKRVERGEAVWVAPFADWLRAAARRHGWDLLAAWAGMPEKSLRRYVVGDTLTVDLAIPDRLLLAEGNTPLEALYPADDPDVGGPLAA